jgi:hypothetical protein
VFVACGVGPAVDAVDGGGPDLPPHPDAGTVPEAPVPLDAAAPPSWPDCPKELPDTSSEKGADLTREGLGCYGSCGPECKAECLEDTLVVSLPAPGLGCQECTYRIRACKSHAYCRWHDDCYRQCDLRWAAAHAEPPPGIPNNPCYLSCDEPIATTNPLCGLDWTQAFTSKPSVRDSCWDGSLVVVSALTSARKSPAACAAGPDTRPRPFAPNTGSWSSTDVPLPSPTRDFSCTHDTDCADRNQRCDPTAGSFPATNGWGRCVDAADAGAVNVTPIPVKGLELKGAGRPAGAACWLGYQCGSGLCAAQRCR